MKLLYFLIGLGLFISSCANSKLLEIASPNGEVKITINNQENELSYTLLDKEVILITDSKISILRNKEVTVLETETSHVNETWNPIWGQFSEIRDNFNELELSLDYEGTPATLYVRAYDHGIAFRFHLSDLSDSSSSSYYIEFGLPSESKLYSPSPREQEPFGPLSIASLSKLDTIKHQFTMPLVIEHGPSQYLSFLESDLISAPGFEVMKFTFDSDLNKMVSNNEFTEEAGSLITPWRIILVEDHLGDLVTNTVPLNVAAPNKIKNPSWIKPGKTLWDWRVYGYTAPDGFTYGADNESYFRFIDYAAANDIEYFMIDNAWFKHAKPGHFELTDNLNLEKVEAYAEEKGVSLILYYDRRHGEYGDQALYPYYESLGMKGIKYGFMGRNVPFTRDAIRTSAEHNLMIDFHDGPVPLTGVSRTYPNAITKEYCHAQQDSRRAFTPKAFIRMALINAIQGPLDMNNGVFDINDTNAGNREKGPRKLNSLITTAAAEAARTLIIHSGLVCIPDAPEAYAAKQDLFEFIMQLPIGKWDESRVLHAKMDTYITTARRHGEEWFIGSVHTEGGALDISFDFLKGNQDYKITFYEDKKETDSNSNPEAYQISTATVKKDDLIKIRMVAGGGHCMWIRPDKN